MSSDHRGEEQPEISPDSSRKKRGLYLSLKKKNYKEDSYQLLNVTNGGCEGRKAAEEENSHQEKLPGSEAF